MKKLSPHLAISARDQALYAWVALLALMATLTVTGLVLGGYGIENPITVAVLVVAAIVVERATVPFPGGELSAGSLIFVFAAVALGPLPAAVVAAAGLLVDLPRRDTAQPILRWLTWTSLRVLEGVAASFAALAIAHFAGAGLLGTFAMVLAAFTADSAEESESASATKSTRSTSPAKNTSRPSRTTAPRNVNRSA